MRQSASHDDNDVYNQGKDDGFDYDGGYGYGYGYGYG